MSLFATRPNGPLIGRPKEAEHCECPNPNIHRGRCLRCCKWPEFTVRRTFADQAKRAARGQRWAA